MQLAGLDRVAPLRQGRISEATAEVDGPVRMCPRPVMGAAFLRSGMLGEDTSTQPVISEICPCRQQAGRAGRGASPRRPDPARMCLRPFMDAAFLRLCMSGEDIPT
mgnify:CR=1 FL=1